MTGCRRAYGRSRMPRRSVPWSQKVFFLEQSKRNVQVEAKWQEGIFVGIRDDSETAVVDTPHGAVVATSIRSVPKEDSGDGMLQHQRVPWGLQPGVEREVVNRVQLDVRAAIPERQAPPTTVGEQLPRRWNWQGTGARTSVSGASIREIGIEAGGSQRGMPCQDCQAHDR